MRAIGTLILVINGAIAVYGYTMLFGAVGAMASLFLFPVAMIAFPFIYAVYMGVFPVLYVALLIIGGLMMYAAG